MIKKNPGSGLNRLLNHLKRKPFNNKPHAFLIIGSNRQTANFVIKRAARNSDVQEIISGMLSNEVARDELSDPSFYFKILFS